MKAWFVYADDSYEWGDYVHGETPGKAKSMFWSAFGTDLESFCQLQPIRVSLLDDKPLTRENLVDALDLQDWDAPIICRCEICKGANK